MSSVFSPDGAYVLASNLAQSEGVDIADVVASESETLSEGINNAVNVAKGIPQTSDKINFLRNLFQQLGNELEGQISHVRNKKCKDELKLLSEELDQQERRL